MTNNEPLAESIESARQFWAKIARENNWYSEPFHVQVWVKSDGTVSDSVAYRGMTHDVIVAESDAELCDVCDDEPTAWDCGCCVDCCGCGNSVD